MKISIYFDVYPWTADPSAVFPTTTPSEKQAHGTRYRVDVEIPDPKQPDVVLTADAVAEGGAS